MITPLTDYSRLCIHTMTTKPWSLAETIAGFTEAGVPSITVWRQHLETYGPEKAGQMLRDSGLRVVSLCRGGFFPAETADSRQTAIDDNRRAIAEAATIGAPLVVLVPGAVPGMPLDTAKGQILDGIAAILPDAEAAGVRLAIEPLHPMYADSRSAIVTLAQANDAVSALASPWVGVAVDVYHLWWDSALEDEIRRAENTIFAFHVCDWRTPTRDLLNDRGLMGEGCIDIRGIRGMVEQSGFTGAIEVEIFSNTYWAEDQTAYVERIKVAYQAHC